MNVIAPIILLAVLIFATPLSRAQERGTRELCSAQTQEAVAAALKYSVADVPQDYSADRIDLKSPVVPDYGILRRHGTIYVRSYLDIANCILGAQALPPSTNVTLGLVGDEELLALAQREGNGVAYVRVGEVRVRDGEVTIDLGVALRLAPDDERIVACCCGGEMVLRRDSEKWLFEEWRKVFCR